MDQSAKDYVTEVLLDPYRILGIRNRIIDPNFTKLKALKTVYAWQTMRVVLRTTCAADAITGKAQSSQKFISLSISLLVNPIPNFLIAFLNSKFERSPVPCLS